MNRIRIPLSVILLAAASAYGGTFTADFSTQDTSTFFLNGSGALSDGSAWMPFIDTNRLILTVNQNNLSGSFSPVDFDNGAAIDSFVASFKLQFGPGTSTPADGAAFSFGPDVNQNSVSYNEVGAGGASFAVSFHTYTSNGGPAVDVYLFGQRIGHVPLTAAQMVNSQLQNVVIQLKPNSTLDVTYAGQVLYTNLYLPGWGPTNGFFIVSARTGGANEQTHLANVSINTSLFTNTAAPTITSAPKSATVNEGASTNFSVGFDGTGPFSIQWLKNGSPIQNATNQTLMLTAVSYADNNAAISALVTNLSGSVTSAPATLTVIRDTTAPTVTKTSADTTFTSILITYSKPVSDTALAASNYSIDNGATVSGVSRVDASTVKLTTSQLTQGVTYNLTINGVQDTASVPNTIAANTKVQVHPFVYLGGSVLHKKYNNVSDSAGYPVSNLFNDPRYPDAPDRVDIESSFEYPPGGAARVAADPSRDYFDSVEGYFIPPTTTNYVFFVSGADRVGLFLSTDDSPANKYQIASINGWTNPRGWGQGQGNTDMTTARSDSNSVTMWPNGNTISLTAGQKYYLLLVHHDPSWSGADDFAATYKIDGENDPAVGDAPKLNGSTVGFYFDPTGASINFTQQPTNTSVLQGNTATLSARATGVSVYGTNVLYQWQSAPAGSTTFTNIPGATGSTFTTPLLGLSDNGTQYRVVATVAPITQTSSVASVSVTTDTTPPVVSAGAMPDQVAGTVDVGVGFNKPIDSSVGQMANYSVSGGTIASLTVYTNRFTANSKNPLAMVLKQSVLLKVTGLTGNSGVLTVKNITDTHGNTLASTNVPFTVSGMQWGVVGGNELGGTNAVVPVATNGFDIYSDGIAEWANYDEATFVYEPITGDFDKKLRVEYQDGSSQWARAGLVVRDVTNFGVDRNGQATNGLAGRYQKCFVTPVGATLTGPGSAGNQDWELNRRLLTGGQTAGAPMTGPNSIPKYPNGWCRIQRTGQTFTMFRSDDGVTWVNLGQTTFGSDGGSTNMPNTVYVGPEYSPETGNIPVPSDRGTFLAQIRDYGDFVGVFNPQLSITPAANGTVKITWSAGTLLSSPTVNGSYTAVQGTTNNQLVVTPAPGTATFYRVKQ